MDTTSLNQTLYDESYTTLEGMYNSLDDVLPARGQLNLRDGKKAIQSVKVREIIFHCMFLVVGLFGNILTMAVLISKKWTNLTSRHILIALAVSDTIMLFCHTFNQDFMKILFNRDVRTFSEIGCKLFYVFYRTSKLTSSWFVVFLCFERFVAVRFPYYVKTIITSQRTKIYILATYLSMASFALVLSFSNEVDESNICTKGPSKAEMISAFKVLVFTEMVFYSLLPTILMSVLTPIIILQLCKRYRAKKRLANQSKTVKERETKKLQEMIRTTTVLISVVAAFVLCVTPITIFQQAHIWFKSERQEVEEKEIIHSVTVFREIAQRLEQINYSINFFLYIFTSPTFRKAVLEMFHIKRN